MGGRETESILFFAWEMGAFGPFAFPGGLNRARQHAHGWPEADTVVAAHRGFIRLRISYAGGGPKALIIPTDYDPVGELLFLTKLTPVFMRVPGALGYFNPNGEVLCNETLFQKVWTEAQHRRFFPFPLWSNSRFYTLNDELGFMDTVGNEQFDIRDVEAAFESDPHDPAKIASYLRNVTHYLMSLGREIQTGESIDGPNERNLSWIAESRQKGAIEPPRPVLRLCPKSIQHQVENLLGGL